MSPTITRIEVAPVRIVGPSLLIKLWAGDVYGLGECYPSGPIAAVNACVQQLFEMIHGEDPRRVQMLAEKMRRSAIFTGAQGGKVITAISGIEFALWDLAGKLTGAPVHQLLGGKFRDSVRLYADCHAGTVDAAGHHTGSNDVPDPATEEGRAIFAESANRALDRGFTAVKFDVDDVHGELSHDEWNRQLTTSQIDRMVRQVGAIRDAVGRDIDLAIDMHARYDLPSSKRAARALEEFNLLWLEEPLPPENIQALAEVKSSTSTPICAGENLYTRYPFVEMITSHAVDYVMPDLAKFGGLSEGRKVADLAELHYIPFAPHNVSGPIGTVAAAHLCASVSNFSVLEWHAIDLDYFEDLVTYAAGPVVQDGRVQMTDAPGFGLELNDDVARKYWHRKSGIAFFGEQE